MKPEYVVSYAWKGGGDISKSKLYYRPDLRTGDFFQACDCDGNVTAKTAGYVIDTGYTSESESDIRVAFASPEEDDEKALQYFTCHAGKLQKKLKTEASLLREKAIYIRSLAPEKA